MAAQQQSGGPQTRVRRPPEKAPPTLRRVSTRVARKRRGKGAESSTTLLRATAVRSVEEETSLAIVHSVVSQLAPSFLRPRSGQQNAPWKR